MTAHGYTTLDPLGSWPTGCRRVRLWDCGMTWRDMNPAPGVFDFSRLDAVVTAHPDAHLTLVLAGTPQWAARDPHSPGAAPWIGEGSNSPPANLADWRRFLVRLMTEFAGRIAAYQVWNEPQLREFWFPYSQIGALGKMTATARVVAQRVAPGTRLVGAPVLPRPSSGGMKRASRYLSALAANGWPIDVHAAHIYPEPGRTAVRWNEMVAQWKAGLLAAGAPRLPLWVTETNANLMAGPLPESTIPTRIRGTLKYAARSGVDQVYWYCYPQHSDPRVLGIPFGPGTTGSAILAPYL